MHEVMVPTCRNMEPERLLESLLAVAPIEHGSYGRASVGRYGFPHEEPWLLGLADSTTLVC